MRLSSQCTRVRLSAGKAASLGRGPASWQFAAPHVAATRGPAQPSDNDLGRRLWAYLQGWRISGPLQHIAFREFRYKG